VSQTAFEEWPQEFTPAIEVEKLPEGKLHRAEVGGMGVLLYRQGSRIHALADRCTHRGCSLADGETDGASVTCPCHGSTFRLEDGEILKGPATAPAPSFEVRRRGGKVEVRIPAST
jgi:nitrite reductase/ring-hydroxylating ferredoxin subunit